MRRYTVIVAREDDSYIVDVPALPGCHTYGATYQEALASAREAIELYLEELRARGERIPEDVPVQLATLVVAA